MTKVSKVPVAFTHTKFYKSEELKCELFHSHVGSFLFWVNATCRK